jgi:hypothetical protein
MTWRIAVVLAALAVIGTTPAAAKTYSAERFDASIRVLAGGHLEVTETVVFRFEEGTFERVFREIPTRRTDDVRVLRATMDGRELPFGEERGQVEVSYKSRVRVEWRFTPLSDTSRTFTLTYTVRGVAYPAGSATLVRWRALPDEHDYRIDRSTVEIHHPSTLAAAPDVETRRVENTHVDRLENSVRIVSTGIRKNGWIEPSLRFEPAALDAVAPEWFQRAERAAAFAPRWIAAAATVGVIGLMALWMLRQRYDTPSRATKVTSGVASVPEPLPPAVAGALAANGRVRLEQAMAALFALAERGELEIREDPKGLFGQRNFNLVRRRSTRLDSLHEQTAVEIAFRDKDHEENTVALNKARTRLTRRFSRFKQALREDMATLGLVDRERQYVHARYGAVSLGIILLSALAFGAMALLVGEYQGWPMLIPAAMMAVGIIGFIFQASTTPLSNAGVERREQWRAYQAHLKDVAHEKLHLTSESPATVLPFAVSLGLAGAWAKFLQSRPGQVPSWFHAITAHGDDGAFPAFIGSGGAGASGGGAGGAAGGGASGAS